MMIHEKTKTREGYEFLSWTYSWWAWRKITNEFQVFGDNPRTSQYLRSKSESGDMCPYCKEEAGIYHSNTYGIIRCLCDTLDYMRDIDGVLSHYRSQIRPAFMKDLTIGHIENSTQYSDGVGVALRYSKMTNVIEQWIDEPDSWLVFQGDVGIGKTHMMAAIAHAFGPMALYITAADFNARVFNSMNDKENGGLGMFIKAVRTAPILLFDDWGMEHNSEFPDAQFRSIIDFRYRNPKEYPTVISTNMPMKTVRKQSGAINGMEDVDPRITSRLLDNEISKLIKIHSVDYRRAKKKRAKSIVS